MALKPQGGGSTRVIAASTKPQTSRTYSIFEPITRTETTQSATLVTYDITDTDAFEIGGIIDGVDAVRQVVRKALITPRFRHMIYNSLYGSELSDLIDQDVTQEFLRTEIPRIITEALIYDDRIRDVGNFAITREGDKLYVSFDVSTVEGVITEEVTM
jgi:phage baseplate assembly protein W